MKSKGMSALLDERSKRQKDNYSTGDDNVVARSSGSGQRDSLKSLVESVKRKSSTVEQPGIGKRRKL